MIIISIFLSNVHVIFTRVSNPEPNQLHNGVWHIIHILLERSSQERQVSQTEQIQGF